MKIAIIYHDADFDGKLSNEVCRHHLRLRHPEARIDSYGWDYGRPVPGVALGLQAPLETGLEGVGNRFPTWEDYDEIYIVDLSVDELMARPELRDKIVWIDHHKSAIEKWDRRSEVSPGPGLFQGLRIDGVAACRLCWQWFTWDTGQESLPPLTKSLFVAREVVEPRLLTLAGEYDIWDKEKMAQYPEIEALQFGLRCCTKSELANLVAGQFAGTPESEGLLMNVIAGGAMVKAYCDKQNDEYSAQYAHTIKFRGLRMCALNIGQRGNSQLLRGGLKPEHQACFAWRWVGDAVMVSLYHVAGHEEHDLSKIAVRYGGGGHKGACGFRVTLGVLEQMLNGEHSEPFTN